MDAAIQLNEKGFEGDKFLKEEFQRLIDKHKTNIIIETGTYLGNTTKQLAEMVATVFTVEENEDYFFKSNAKFVTARNVLNYKGSSVDILPGILAGPITSGESNQNVLFFLDAHWGENNPLLQELEIIANHKIKPIIVIHDFKVPDHPELGYDSYDGQDYEWSWIEKSVEAIYGPGGYTYHYNTQAEGAKRGVIFIEPK